MSDALKLLQQLAGLAPITEDDMAPAAAPAANKVTPKNLGNIVQTNIRGWDEVGNLLYTIGANLKQMGKSNMVPSGQAINNYRIALYNIIAWAENPANKVDSKTVDRISKVIGNVRATSGNGIERGQGELPQGWAMDAGQELIDLRMDLYNGGYTVGGKML
jgi:hypothetical protein